jgi:iron(III) transport system substrate-binding protein
MASVIAEYGLKKAEIWAAGVVSNLARRPQGNDRAQVKAIYEGLCDVAIINNYYFGKLKYSDDPVQRKWADSMRLTFPNQGMNDRGAHINISGGGVTKYSKNKASAIKLLEFLSSAKAQRLYGEINFEYPANPEVESSEELKSWGLFREDKVAIEKIAQLSIEAQKIIDKVGW